MTHSIAFLEAFNAKQMTIAEIANSFVPSEKFDELAGAWNVLLLGPRGSGKTTLLKMLQLKALRKWDHPAADKYRNEINYTGIFIPADIAWGGMVDHLGRGKLEPDAKTLIQEAVFCSNVFQSVVEALGERIQIRENDLRYRVIDINDEQINNAIGVISEIWKIQPKFNTLDSLRLCVNLRLMEIKSVATTLALTGRYSAKDVQNELPYATIDVIEAVEAALTEFDKSIGDPDGRWALLLDEFEIAPIHLQEKMVSQFRSSNKKLLFKVALAPCVPQVTGSREAFGSANKRDDFKQVELWYSVRSSALSFCDDVFSSRMKGYPGIANKSPEDVLGNSTYAIYDEGGRDSSESAYDWSKDLSKIFIALREKDVDFSEFLDRREIDPNNLDQYKGKNIGNTIRKIAPLVAIREAHKRSAENQTVKGRKKLPFSYSGRRAIYAISEGNPRWLIAILNMIVSKYGEGKKLPISEKIQTDQIIKATESFKSMMKTVATNQMIGIQTKKPVFELLEQIGKYFFDRVVKDRYIEEPPLTFIVDDKISSDIENSLRIALNHGAIVYLQQEGDISDFQSLKGKKFRIAYLLAPSFHLPLRATKEIALSTILDRDKQVEITVSQHNIYPSQEDLFGSVNDKNL